MCVCSCMHVCAHVHFPEITGRVPGITELHIFGNLHTPFMLKQINKEQLFPVPGQKPEIYIALSARVRLNRLRTLCKPNLAGVLAVPCSDWALSKYLLNGYSERQLRADDVCVLD